MKLLFVIPEIATAGGAEKIVTSLASYLAENYGHDVTILNCLPYYKQSFYPIATGVKVDSLNYSGYPKSILKRLNWYLQLVKPLNNYLQTHQFDVVFAESSYVAASLSMCRVECIKVCCDHISYHAVHFMHKLLRKFLFKKLSAIVVLTEEDRQLYLKHHSQVYCIPNFVTALLLTPSMQNTKSIVAVGRLEEQKGFDLLIEAMVIVNQSYPDWQLVIYGDGSQKNLLKESIKAKELDQIIYLAGETADVQTEMCKASIFVLSSRYEGFPLSLIEAMSCGLSCVSFEMPGVSALVKDNYNGLLVRKADVSALGNAIIQLITDQNLRKQLASGAIRTASHYKLALVAPQWQRLLVELAHAKQ